jgi:citrate lyase subunit gamma (acyl carrier protein)
MNSVKTVRTAQAGTVESMDCLVTVSESDEGRIVEITGSGAARFKDAMEAKINAALDALEASSERGGVRVSVQDNGALDIVLGARVEAAYRRFEEVRGA